MRLWSLHPKYLDAKGLVALWREALLAKKVLENKTKGYRNHPQLIRFRNSRDPLNNINHYLSVIFAEASSRNYNFDRTKIDWSFRRRKIPVTVGQLDYESEHLKNKLKNRDKERLQFFERLKSIDPHPIFKLRKGKVEEWEVQDSR